jgi:hypothetical protein
VTNPLLHTHEFADWSAWAEIPGTNLRARMRGCITVGCLMITMDCEPADQDLYDETAFQDPDQHHIADDARCKDNLIEKAWEDEGTEGFTCALPHGHKGAHRACTNPQERLTSTHKDGRPYEWAHEWMYGGSQ